MTICSLSQNQMMLLLTPRSKNDRNIYELFATPAIIQMAMIFYKTLEDVCDWKLTGILNNVESVLYYCIVKSSQ